MNWKTIFIIGAVVFAAGLLWYYYLRLGPYFDQALSPKQALKAFWMPAVPMFVGALIMWFGIKKI